VLVIDELMHMELRCNIIDRRKLNYWEKPSPSASFHQKSRKDGTEMETEFPRREAGVYLLSHWTTMTCLVDTEGLYQQITIHRVLCMDKSESLLQQNLLGIGREQI
jgi:hypothetical protein